MDPVTTNPATSQERALAEDERVRQVYARRQIDSTRYARTHPFALFSSHEREAAMVALFRSQGLLSLEGLRILDVGCGKGQLLRQLLEFGATPGLLHGVDLLEDRIEEARRLSPQLDFRCSSAVHLPYSDESFDLVVQCMLFSSVLDRDVKRSISAEMRRVLAPGGRILWYDFTYNNPRNPDVRGITRREIADLFPGFRGSGRRITLAPPIGRAAAPLGAGCYNLLSGLRLLDTHYICLLRRPHADAQLEDPR